MNLTFVLIFSFLYGYVHMNDHHAARDEDYKEDDDDSLGSSEQIINKEQFDKDSEEYWRRKFEEDYIKNQNKTEEDLEKRLLNVDKMENLLTAISNDIKVLTKKENKNQPKKELLKKYAMRYKKVNWFRAMELCQAEGRSLVAIMDELQKRNLIETLKRTNPNSLDAWIGATDLAQKGHFTWMANGQTVSLFNMIQDNHGYNNHCVKMDLKTNKGQFGWRVANCNESLPFVCQYYQYVNV